MAELGVHQPVDERVDLGLDHLRDVVHHPVRELLLEPGSVEELGQPSEADRLVEELHPALLHPEQAVVDVGQPEIELAPHIVAPGAGLAGDVVNRAEVLGQQAKPRLDR